MKPRIELPYLSTALLLLGVIILLTTIGFELGWGQRINLPLPQFKPQKSKVSLTPLLPEFALPPLEPSFNGTVERPLFVPTRKPPPKQEVIPPQQHMRTGQFLLLGVIMTKEKNVALLREIATGKVSRVEQGKEINGITVEKLEPEKVTLKQYDDREEIVLKIQAMPKPTQMAAPAPAPLPMPGGPSSIKAAGPTAMPTDIQGVIARRRGLAP